MSGILLTPTELAEELGIPRATLSQWRWKGEGPLGIRIGKRLRYRRQDVDEWIERLAEAERNKAGGK